MGKYDHILEMASQLSALRKAPAAEEILQEILELKQVMKAVYPHINKAHLKEPIHPGILPVEYTENPLLPLAETKIGLVSKELFIDCNGELLIRSLEDAPESRSYLIKKIQNVAVWSESDSHFPPDHVLSLLKEAASMGEKCLQTALAQPQPTASTSI